MMDDRKAIADVLAEIGRKARRAKRIVFVSGNFNVVHPGHLRLLQFAAECGDFLVVGVHDQSFPGAKLPEEMRLEGVRAIAFVKHAFILNEPPEQFIARLHPAVVVKGKEYDTRQNPEQAVVDSYGGELRFGSGEVRFSSLDLLHREYFEANYSAIRKPMDFAKRHGFGVPELTGHLARFKSLRVMVIGDLIIDEYIDCDPLGMSQEDPTIVVTPIDKTRFVGGAGIVAAHARGLGAAVHFFSVAGEDETAAAARDMLTSHNVDHTIITDDSRPTTLKQRFRAAGKTMLRVSHLRQHEVRPELSSRILEAVEARIPDTDLIVFSDFNYGCLPQGLVDQVIALGRKRGISMVADSQASSQLSDVSRFVGMNLITPTEREARLALRDSSSGLAVVAEVLRKKSSAGNVAITLGSEGVLIHAQNASGWITDQLPAFNSAPRDSAGAGDSFLTCASMALCAGVDIWQAVYLGSLAAACQVSRVGNTPLTQQDLVAEIEQP
jgi:rfaE bifunctional protein kinase chain/domain